MNLIVIDGLDGSGKSTQTDLLLKAMEKHGVDAKYLKFPNYQDKSSALVRMYLDGEIAKTPDDVNPFAAAAFYACDRYISYIKSWGEHYNSNKTIVCDRYVTSNAIHQMVKQKQSEWDGFLQWLEDFEYNKLQLPRPNTVIYLDMESEIAASLIAARYKGDETKKDIHEQNLEFMQKCREAALYAASKLNWNVIKCFENGKPISINDIHEKVMGIV